MRKNGSMKRKLVGTYSPIIGSHFGEFFLNFHHFLFNIHCVQILFYTSHKNKQFLPRTFCTNKRIRLYTNTSRVPQNLLVLRRRSQITPAVWQIPKRNVANNEHDNIVSLFVNNSKNHAMMLEKYKIIKKIDKLLNKVKNRNVP